MYKLRLVQDGALCALPAKTDSAPSALYLIKTRPFNFTICRRSHNFITLLISLYIFCYLLLFIYNCHFIHFTPNHLVNKHIYLFVFVWKLILMRRTDEYVQTVQAKLTVEF